MVYKLLKKLLGISKNDLSKIPTRFTFLSETGPTFENRSTFTAPKRGNRHKKKKHKKTHIIEKSIHSSLR